MILLNHVIRNPWTDFGTFLNFLSFVFRETWVTLKFLKILWKFHSLELCQFGAIDLVFGKITSFELFFFLFLCKVILLSLQESNRDPQVSIYRFCLSVLRYFFRQRRHSISSKFLTGTCRRIWVAFLFWVECSSDIWFVWNFFLIILFALRIVCVNSICLNWD